MLIRKNKLPLQSKILELIHFLNLNTFSTTHYGDKYAQKVFSYICVVIVSK